MKKDYEFRTVSIKKETYDMIKEMSDSTETKIYQVVEILVLLAIKSINKPYDDRKVQEIDLKDVN